MPDQLIMNVIAKTYRYTAFDEEKLSRDIKYEKTNIDCIDYRF